MSPNIGHYFDLLDLRADQESPEAIDTQIRAGVRVGGTNLWVLFFAMLVASVGLNVNSTAVIIGAMLISPLMGPIVGIGYGAAVNDTALIARAAKNLGIFTVLSLLASTAYFWLSPLTEPGSELLARTTPNLWDVLIAAFGGAAGMVGATRRGFTNVVPGVAIATALMPPLCTAGFGVAHARWDFVSGAFYLFVINGVFIAAATLVVSRVLALPPQARLDEATSRRTQWLISIGLLTVLVPAVWLGVRFVQQEVFAGQARAVVRDLQSDADSSVVASSITGASRRVELTVIGGADIERQTVERARALLTARGASDFHITTRRVGALPDARELRRQVGNDVALGVAQRLSQLESRLLELQERDTLEVPAAVSHDDTPSADTLLAEARALERSIQALAILNGVKAGSGAGASAAATVVLAEVPKRLPVATRRQLEGWVRQRTRQPEALFVDTVVAPSR